MATYGGRRARLAGLICAAAVVVVCGGAELPREQAGERLAVVNYMFASFSATDFQLGRLRVLKDASISGGALQLTPDTSNNDGYLVNKSGSVLLPTPFTLWRRLSDSTASGVGNGNGTGGGGGGGGASTAAQRVRVVSFNSTFSINVHYKNENGRVPGEGLAFVVAPSLDGPPPGSDGGYLGLTNATMEADPARRSRFVAVELDTVRQSYDPSDNHVGLDLGTVISDKTANLSDFNITVATHEQTSSNYTVWVEYGGAARRVTVYMGVRGRPRPAAPVLDAPLDLSEHVPDQAYLGFAASTGASFELNCVLDWSLTIEVFPPEKEKKTWIVAVAVLSGAVVAAAAIAAFFLGRRAMARRSMERKQERLGLTLSHLPGMPREFSYDKLRKATRNFDERQRLGKGGYGEVYRGLLPAGDGQPAAMEVAVKRFTRDDAKRVDDFVMEVDIINRLRHKNVVPLVGWCYKKGQLLLVYEYMPNGSLDEHLFRRDGGGQEDERRRRPALSWASRYGIVGDVAAGLHYVHHEYGRMVLHRDIKASNVMLDASMAARLGDFGLARVIEFDRSSFTDIAVAGTRGYIAPEYSVGHRASRQTDVFAFGALVLELVTGRYALLGDPACPALADWVWRMHGRGALVGAVDQDLGTEGFDAEEASRLLLLGLACSSPNPGDRPTMPQVLQILSKTAPPPDVPPFKPTFVWPPEGGGGSARFSLSDLDLTSSGATATAGASSADARRYDTSGGSLRTPTAANSNHDCFPELSSGR